MASTNIFSKVLAPIIGAVVIAGGIVGGFALSDTSPEPSSSQPIQGQNIPVGSTLETVAGFPVPYVDKETCYSEFWILPREYTGINHFLHDGNKGATPDGQVVIDMESCPTTDSKQEAYDKYTNMWMDGGKRWTDGKEMVA